MNEIQAEEEPTLARLAAESKELTASVTALMLKIDRQTGLMEINDTKNRALATRYSDLIEEIDTQSSSQARRQQFVKEIETLEGKLKNIVRIENERPAQRNNEIKT